MTIEVLMPALSPTMEEGTLASWIKNVGDKVEPGDVIAEIETDKATMEVEAAEEGTLGKILVEAGTEGVKVNSVIAILLEEGEDEGDIDASASGANGAAASSSDESEDDGADEDGKSDAKAAEETAETVAEDDNDGVRVMSSFDKSGTRPIDEQDVPSIDERRVPAIAKEHAEPKGFPALADPDVPDGVEMKEQTVREALRDAMAEEMRADDRVFVMGEEVAEYQGAYKVTQGLLDEFGSDRVIDTPITEHGFAGIGVGAAMAGLRPIVEFMTFNFAMQAIDQIVNSAGKTRYMAGGELGSPMVFRGPNGAAARVAAQHSQDYAAWYSSIPGLIVIQPYSAADAKGLLKAAIRDPNPVVFLENEILYGRTFDVPDDDDFTLPIGKARVWKEGSDITLVSFGIGMTYALQAATELSEMGIDAEVIDLRTIRPLDMDAIVKSVKKTNRLITIEEGFPQCSVGDHIANQVQRLAFDYLDAPILTIAGKDVPMPYAANLEVLALPSVGDVIAGAKALLYKA